MFAFMFFLPKRFKKMQLFNVTTKNAGQALRKAVHLSQNPVLQTKLCTAISPDDAHAIDVKYYKSCWTEHVFHVLRDSGKESETNNYCMQQSMQNACFTELVNLTYKQKTRHIFR